MKEKLEKIDELRRRANVSYQLAKEALEKNDYDVLEALIDLEKEGKVDHGTPAAAQPGEKSEKKTRPSEDGISASIKRLFHKSMQSSFVLKDKNREQVLKLPLLVALVLILITMPVSLVLLILAIVFKYKLLIRHDDGTVTNFNEVIDDLNEEYESVKARKAAEKEAVNLDKDEEQK